MKQLNVSPVWFKYIAKLTDEQFKQLAKSDGTFEIAVP